MISALWSSLCVLRAPRDSEGTDGYVMSQCPPASFVCVVCTARCNHAGRLCIHVWNSVYIHIYAGRSLKASPCLSDLKQVTAEGDQRQECPVTDGAVSLLRIGQTLLLDTWCTMLLEMWGVLLESSSAAGETGAPLDSLSVVNKRN